MVMRAYLSPALHQRCIGAESMRSFDLISYRFLVGEAVLASIMLDRSGKPIEEPAVAISRWEPQRYFRTRRYPCPYAENGVVLLRPSASPSVVQSLGENERGR
jgi:hypothetical protein